ncbi:MAG: TldD/PmbA family protein [Caldimicrobium sp.]|nr:TldD/PmbA family protein [Caldimicrobium sp.]MCX7873466.1 TldD/PmbA family protein [Caldimicrobium sp.]MDW8182812.1 metallopeptidase TldD-related protein [Caldimicrobium sp.]
MNLLDYLAERSFHDRALEFYLEINQGYLLDLKDTRPFLEENFEESTLSVRYLNEKHLSGITYTLSLKKDDIELAISRAKSLSNRGFPSVYPQLAETYPDIKTTPFEPLERKDSLSLLERGRRSISSFKEITRLEREMLRCQKTSIYLIRGGKVLTWESPEYSFYLSVVADSGKKQATGYAYRESLDPARLNVESLYFRAGKKATALSKGERKGSLKCPILFPPESAIELISLLSFSLKGDEVIKGRSFLKSKLGKKVFSQALTLIDDGLDPELLESRPFDDEGSPQEKKTLIEKGEVKTFIWDAFYGSMASFSSTGNARRDDPASPPKVDFTNLYLQKGPNTREDLLRRERIVFEVLEILGSHTADPISGDFSFGVSGVLYEGGEEVDYLSEMALSGNIFEILKDIEVGEDLTFFGASGSPSILVSDMDLG